MGLGLMDERRWKGRKRKWEMGDDSPVQTELVSTGSQFSHFWEINTGDNLEFFCWVCFCVLCFALLYM